ncbi:MAG: hypothetical protein AAFR52_11470 [Pseudomonadota bacterium]
MSYDLAFWRYAEDARSRTRADHEATYLRLLDGEPTDGVAALDTATLASVIGDSLSQAGWTAADDGFWDRGEDSSLELTLDRQWVGFCLRGDWAWDTIGPAAAAIGEVAGCGMYDPQTGDYATWQPGRDDEAYDLVFWRYDDERASRPPSAHRRVCGRLLAGEAVEGVAPLAAGSLPGALRRALLSEGWKDQGQGLKWMRGDARLGLTIGRQSVGLTLSGPWEGHAVNPVIEAMATFGCRLFDPQVGPDGTRFTG